jgi:adenylate cyclase
MAEALPELNKAWAPKVGEEFGLSIGINSGIARVGNTGTHRKFKYGPLGSTVNLASRVQGATKYLKSGTIVTAATQQRLGDEFSTRRLCKVRVVNIPEPVELFELRSTADRRQAAFDKRYEMALSEFERQNLKAAAATLSRLLAEHPGDGPSQVLLSRTSASLANSDVEFTEAWELPGK